MYGVTVNSSGKFVAVGYDGSNYPVYATSTDGSTWTTPATMNGSTTVANMYGVTASSSGKFVAVGFNGSNYPVYATSTDGSTWTTPATMNGSTTAANMYGVTVNSSGKFVAVGYDGSNYPVYATSTDGSTWTTPATMNGSTTAAYMLGVTVNSSGKFVAVGYNNDTNKYPVYATSTDGSTWTTPATMNGSTTAAYMYGVTVNSSGKFVAVGFNSSYYPVYATSTDGSTWTTPATMNGSTTAANMYGVTVNSSGKFVAVGYDGSNYPVYATSTDGSTWTTPATMNGSTTAAYMLGVTVNSSGLFVAVGFNGSIYPVYAISSSVSLLSKFSVTPDATFTDVTDGTDTTPFDSGDQIKYVVQAGALSNNTLYYWRVAGKDPLGSNTYGAWSDIHSFTTEAAGGLTFTIDAGSTLEFGTVLPGPSNRVYTTPCTNKCTTRLKVDVGSGGYLISAGRDRSNPATTLASSVATSINISDTGGGINVFDGLGASCIDGTGPAVWGSGVSTGLGFTLWAADINKETACWGSGSSQTDALNTYAALPASVGASSFLSTTTSSPNPSYASVGWSLSVTTGQRATDYTGQVIFTATTNP